MTEATPAAPDTGAVVPGTAIWIDLGTSSTNASAVFYRGLFGWETFIVPDPAAGGYGFFMLDGKMAAGVGPLMDPNAPPAWTVYFATENADVTVQKVRDAGGQVIFGPMDVLDSGRLAICADPAGAVFGLWQPQTNTGVQVRNQPNSLAWVELNTRDIAAAKTFYADVFSWRHKDYEGENPYTEWMLGERSVGGGWNMTGRVPDNVPPYWLAYFAVADCDASLDRARELGATVVVPPMDIAEGRLAVINDPQGATLALMAFPS